MILYNGLLLGFLIVYVLQTAFSLWLEYLNRNYLKEKGRSVPQVFDGFIDLEKLDQSRAYTLENSRFSIQQELFAEIILLIFLLSGFFPFLDHLATGWRLPFVWAGLFFFLVPGVISYVLDLPFDYYHTFVIEEKYGFNQSTKRVWATDQLKSGVLSLVLFSLVLSLLLGMIRFSPHRWWLGGFLVLSAVQLLLTILYPILIAPLFNKFIPIQDEVLGQKIKTLMERAGIQIKGIFQMDAGKRSRHTNAYFTGLGKTKRIVLYDTLIQSHPQEEVLAVLAHEAGHFKKKHILKQFLLIESAMLIFLYLTYLLIDWPFLYRTFGFEMPKTYAGLLLIGIFWQKAGFFLTPFSMALSRRFERQADTFAVRLLGSSSGMITGLKRLAADNLSNLSPHPLYVGFHYSHPPLMERIASLQDVSDAKFRTDPLAKQRE
jgi:STE24 endopeptidase